MVRNEVTQVLGGSDEDDQSLETIGMIKSADVSPQKMPLSLAMTEQDLDDVLMSNVQSNHQQRRALQLN